MDAISFVLGVKSSQLRSNQLKELIHRPAAGEILPMDAYVSALYETKKGSLTKGNLFKFIANIFFFFFVYFS